LRDGERNDAVEVSLSEDRDYDLRGLPWGDAWIGVVGLEHKAAATAASTAAEATAETADKVADAAEDAKPEQS
jgi:hypothetical protein